MSATERFHLSPLHLIAHNHILKIMTNMITDSIQTFINSYLIDFNSPSYINTQSNPEQPIIVNFWDMIQKLNFGEWEHLCFNTIIFSLFTIITLMRNETYLHRIWYLNAVLQDICLFTRMQQKGLVNRNICSCKIIWRNS